MMDELELLKKDWQNKDINLPKLSYDDIHKMTWKKSSSIVKWILIISILEFTLPHLLYLLPTFKENMSIYDAIGVSRYLYAISFLQYSVVFYFIYQFYNRYKEISVLEDAKTLMHKIIKTRKTVKNYVIFSLSMILVIIFTMILGIYFSDNLIEVFEEFTQDNITITQEKLKVGLMVGIGVIGIVLTLFMGGIYFLLYGRLLKKLNYNYKKLQQFEV